MTDDLHRTDMGNAGRFIAQHGHQLRYMPKWGTWLVWDGTRWTRDDTYVVFRLARATIRSMYQDASMIDDKSERVNAARWAIASESKGRIEAMIALATSEQHIAVSPDDLDADPFVLNCRNGTLDLRSGQLRPHDPADLLTKRLNIDYDPAAPCPTWQRFLQRVLNADPELIRYVQRCVGYTLTGATTEQCLFFAYGTGRNGKSTFFEVLKHMLGEYAQKAPTEIIMLKANMGISNDVARLAGARLVITAEIEEGRRLSESLVKDLTGGDTISARFLYQETFEFLPTHKLWLYGNHRPDIRGTDPGIWRRIRVIPFDVQIPASEVDPYLRDKLLAELPGILAWAVRGCQDHQDNGLPLPEAVQRATQEYRSDMDMLAAFMSDCCVVRADAVVKASDLYKAYTTWCEENGERAVTQRRLGQQLTERGFERRRMGKDDNWHRVGIGLLANPGQAPTDPTDPTDPISQKSAHVSRGHESFENHPKLDRLDRLDEGLPPPGQGNPAAEQARMAGTGPGIDLNPVAFEYWKKELGCNSPALERLPAICKERGWDYKETVALLRQALEKEASA